MGGKPLDEVGDNDLHIDGDDDGGVDTCQGRGAWVRHSEGEWVTHHGRDEMACSHVLSFLTCLLKGI